MHRMFVCLDLCSDSEEIIITFFILFSTQGVKFGREENLATLSSLSCKRNHFSQSQNEF